MQSACEVAVCPGILPASPLCPCRPESALPMGVQGLLSDLSAGGGLVYGN